MLLTVHPRNPQPRLISQIAEVLRKGGVIIYPTDTIYGLGCDIFHPKAIEKICRIKQIEPTKANFSFICKDLSHLSDYAKSIDTPTYRLLKSHLPGPYTFILPSSKQVPKLLQHKKATIGIRVPDNTICRYLLEALGNPIISTSLPGDRVEDYTDPEIIHSHFENLVDLVVDGGIGGMVPSTIINCSEGEAQLVRQGAGKWESEH